MRPARASRTPLEGDTFLAALPARLACALRSALNDEPFRMARTWSGGGSECALLVTGGRRIVFKRAKPGVPFEYETAMLARLGSSKIEGLLPRLIASFPGERAFLMEFVGPHDTRAALEGGADPVGASTAIGEALRSYHRETGTAFGDFHPANVFLHAAETRFIDPAPPGWHRGPAGEDPIITDLALWTYSTAANLPWDARRSPRLAWKMLRLNIELLARNLPSAGTPRATRELRAEVRRHLRGLLRSWPRDKLVFVLAWVISWATIEASARYGPSAASCTKDAIQVVPQPQRERYERERHSRSAASRHH